MTPNTEYQLQDITSHLQSIEATLSRIRVEEINLEQSGENRAQLIRGVSSIASNVARSSGYSQKASLISFAAVALTAVGTAAFQKVQHHRLQQQRKQYALTHLSQWENYGHLLYDEGERALASFNQLDVPDLQSLKPEHFATYASYAASLRRYQACVTEFYNAAIRFTTNYHTIAAWGDLTTNTRLDSPLFSYDEWIRGRLATAIEQTRASTSVLYNYSLQAHLLLQAPPANKLATKELQDKLVAISEERLRNDVRQLSTLHVYQGRDYLSNAQILLGESRLAGSLVVLTQQIHRRVWLYENRLWILTVVVLCVVAISYLMLR